MVGVDPIPGSMARQDAKEFRQRSKAPEASDASWSWKAPMCITNICLHKFGEKTNFINN